MKYLLAFLAIILMIQCTPAKQVIRAEESPLQTLRKSIAEYNSLMATYEKEAKAFNEDADRYERDFGVFHASHSNQQIDAYNIWFKYRNRESGAAYLALLTPEEYDAALKLEERQGQLRERRTLLLSLAEGLDKQLDALKKLEEITYRQLDYEARIEAQKERRLDNAFWHLYDQNMHTTDMMRQNAFDRLWPR